MREVNLSDIWFILGLLPVTLLLSIVSFAGGLLMGVPVAIARSSQKAIYRIPALIWIRGLQGIPLLVILMIIYFAPPVLFGRNADVWIAAAVGLSVNASSYIAEILRGAVASVPRGQIEAAQAIGLSRWSIMVDVIAPQAVRFAIAPMIGLGVMLIKGTSVASILGMTEVTRAALRVNQLTYEPVPVFGIVCLAYFIICWPLSLLGQHLESRIAPAT